ncbi:MAG: histidine ammonia-lyase [Bacteroidetes bacterium]|nr:histidine ammonia-lyase [Bacteroidota bacterium]
MQSIELSPNKQLSLEKISAYINKSLKISLSENAKKKIEKSRKYLDEKIKSSNKPIYGINTGFGSLCNTTIDTTDLEQLQENLILSHACGIGEEVPAEIVKLMLLFKIQGLSHGNSGVQLSVVRYLQLFYNEDILPVVYNQGSLGASGDLAPLAHLCLPLIGEGEVMLNGKKIKGKDILKKLGLKPIKLKSKEGLALLNGTQFMSSYGIWCLLHAQRLSVWADLIAALSLDAFDGRVEPFDEKLHVIRPHKGQIQVAERVRKILSGSQLIKQPKKAVQDPYSFRCVPQVHGASLDTIDYVTEIFETEINSVTDNPTVFVEEDEIVSGGNFHGQPLALGLDFLAIALAEIGNISERRTYQLISGQRELPPFLAKKSGLNSGFMIPQYTAASIVSQNKQLCAPASVDSIVSSNGQEDHVSMGANAATKCLKVVENCYKILAIELFTAAQALEFRRPLKSSTIIERLIKEYRTKVKFIEKDKLMYPDIHTTVDFIKMYEPGV